MFQVEVVWVVTPCSVLEGYLLLILEDGITMYLRNVGILTQPEDLDLKFMCKS